MPPVNDVKTAVLAAAAKTIQTPAPSTPAAAPSTPAAAPSTPAAAPSTPAAAPAPAPAPEPDATRYYRVKHPDCLALVVGPCEDRMDAIEAYNALAGILKTDAKYDIERCDADALTDCIAARAARAPKPNPKLAKK